MLVSLLLVLLTRPSQGDLTVLAAASLKAPLTKIEQKFEKQNPGAEVNISFAGSQALASQIKLGAPVDIFFSADRAQMDVVIKSGHISMQNVQPFASNELIVLVSHSASGKIKGLKDLGKDGLQFSMAKEKVPVGAYSREFLSRASAQFGEDWKSAILNNVVSYESNVSAIVSRVEMDEVDAGFVYKTDGMRAKKSVSITIPPKFNVSAHYYVGVLDQTNQGNLAERFVELVLSPDGQAILAEYGFTPP